MTQCQSSTHSSICLKSTYSSVGTHDMALGTLLSLTGDMLTTWECSMLIRLSKVGGHLSQYLHHITAFGFIFVQYIKHNYFWFFCRLVTVGEWNMFDDQLLQCMKTVDVITNDSTSPSHPLPLWGLPVMVGSVQLFQQWDLAVLNLWVVLEVRHEPLWPLG